MLGAAFFPFIYLFIQPVSQTGIVEFAIYLDRHVDTVVIAVTSEYTEGYRGKPVLPGAFKMPSHR